MDTVELQWGQSESIRSQVTLQIIMAFKINRLSIIVLYNLKLCPFLPFLFSQWSESEGPYVTTERKLLSVLNTDVDGQTYYSNRYNN